MSPQILEEAYNRADFDRDLVVKFFITFSMFENALKVAGFSKIQRKYVEPDWGKFADDINADFNYLATPELENAVNYILTNPPQKQVIKNNVLDFAPMTRQRDWNNTKWLSQLIRQVRNNLFHGGKFRYDYTRDTLLIQNSLIILETWAQLNEKVQKVLNDIS